MKNIFESVCAIFCFLDFVTTLSIDNKLHVVRNDCYERMAIGERLVPKDIYKTLTVKTIQECQVGCTQEQDICRTFSFGVGAKGNVTCELSSAVIKETPDLKPIGTVSNAEFDLYVKKLGCKIIAPINFPVTSNASRNSSKPQEPIESQFVGKPIRVQSSAIGVASGPGYQPIPMISERFDRYRPHYRPHYGYGHYDNHLDDASYGSYGDKTNYRPDYRPNYYHDYPEYTASSYYDRYSGYDNYGYPHDDYRPRPRPYKRYYFDRPYHRPIRPRPYGVPQVNYNYYDQRPSDDYNLHKYTPDGFERPDHHVRIGKPYRRPEKPYAPEEHNLEVKPVKPSNDPRPVQPTGPSGSAEPNFDYYIRPDRPNHFSEESDRPQMFDYDTTSYGFQPQPSKPLTGNGEHPNNYPPYPVNSTFTSSSANETVQNLNPNTGEGASPTSTGYGFEIHRPDVTPNRPDRNQAERPRYDANFYRPYEPFHNNYDKYNVYHYGRPYKPNRPWLVDETSEFGSSRHSVKFEDRVSVGSESEKDVDDPSPRIVNSKKPARRRPIISTSIGKDGRPITSIITEITAAACFRRVLAGKRIVHRFVRRAVSCERVEDCQRECSDEKRFVCEGFNYRLDSTGHGQGDCELLDLPLERLDITQDVFTDPEYDYYERDRNNDAPECKGIQRSQEYYHYVDKQNYDDRSDLRRYDYDESYRWNDRYDDGYDYQRSRTPPYRDDYYEYEGNRRGGKDFKYHNHGQFFDDYNNKDDYNGKDAGPYKPPKPHYDRPADYDYKSYEPYLPQGFWENRRPYYDHSRYWKKYFYDRQRDRNYWGFPMKQNGWGNYGGSYGNFGKPDSFFWNHNRNYNRYDPYEKKHFYFPPDNDRPKNWGQYGGSYGNGDYKYGSHKSGYDYWGFDRLDRKYNHRPPFFSDNSIVDNSYLPPLKDGGDYNGNHISGGHSYPVNPFVHHHHDHQEEECSLRTCVGFRLHRRVIRKAIAVPHIHQCEILCYKERGFPCASFAFRYTTISNSPENCYLSDRHFKELDYYVDLEPDRDFDIYTMNNLQKCNELTYDSSECFWRVRSGQRLEQKIVRDSLNVDSIVQCQIECLKSQKFTCRAFSYRYGPPAIGGAIDNCQLTDWPYIQLDPKIHLTPEHGFELYDRGSYGHGCEPDHFSIGLKPGQSASDKRDEVCYVVYGSPAKLLAQATKKSIRKETNAECKAECTRLRENTIFQCNSLSYRTAAAKGTPNCDLSDIVQRDLLSNVDYTADPDSWLFAWDNHNPQCAFMYGEDHSGTRPPSGGGSHSGSWDHTGGWTGSESGWNRPRDEWNGSWGGSSNWKSTSTGRWGGGEYQGIESSYERDEHNVIPWKNPFYPLDTWRVYSVRGWPCKSLCKENHVAGFWYCYLEGAVPGSWDYCCRPDHQCGYSEGFSYQWCYVGPSKTQWRKCNEHYYPYHDDSNVHDHQIQYSSHHGTPYLDPPVPGGFGRPRHWPVAYLHKEMPPNETSSEPHIDEPKIDSVKDARYRAIENLINVIKTNDAKDIEYKIANSSKSADDILLVKIPLPENVSNADRNSKRDSDDEVDHDLEAVDIIFSNLGENEKNTANDSAPININTLLDTRTTPRRNPTYAKSYIERAQRVTRQRDS